MDKNNSNNISSFNEISSIIRLKEKELHDIHDMRCKQLEELVTERDQLLLETSHHFDNLREDFQYNLTLLEARDNEIERLEKIILIKQELEEKYLQNEKKLIAKIELLDIRDNERIEKHDQDKITNKRILQELREVVESMKWASEEESKSKMRENESLRDELHRLHSSREDSLESQRRDLTHTFEQLLSQREVNFTNKEREIAHQIAALDSKFEVLHTENSRIKAEYSESIRKCMYKFKIELLLLIVNIYI